VGPALEEIPMSLYRWRIWWFAGLSCLVVLASNSLAGSRLLAMPKVLPCTKLSAWFAEQGTFPASFQLTVVRPDKPNSEKLEENLRALSQNEARKHRHLGYAYGACSDVGGGYYIASSAAPVLARADGQSLEQLTKLGARECGEFWAYRAPGEIREAQSIPAHPEEINLAMQEGDAVSLVCKPKNQANGPALWAIFPGAQTVPEMEIAH